MALTKEAKQAIITKYGENDKDTGSTKVQIALLTAQINALTEHLKNNKQDGSGRKGLFVLVGKRRGLLDYYAEKDYDAYTALIAELGIRK